MIHQLEAMIAKSNNNLKAHNMKRDKYKNNKIDSIWNLALLLQCASILSKSR